MSDLVPVLLLDGLAAGGLWLVYARSPYARRVRRVFGATAAVWRSGQVRITQVAPALDPTPDAVPVAGDVLDVDEETE